MAATSTLPTAIVCVGMAGSGKTTFMQRINSYLHTQREPPYVINLDPAVKNVPFDSNIDIRDSIDYKEVMSQYNLGPNGGILTSLNLFATKVDQILGILEKRCGVTKKDDPSGAEPSRAEPSSQEEAPSSTQQSTTPISNILIDTPGQIEVFVWSASGQILLSSIASSFPTVIAYIIDTPRTASTSTFMSNMLYACSILYKTKLPMILVFNKTDVQSADFAKEWMTDFEAFQAALKREEETGVFGGLESGAMSGQAIGGSGYMSSLLNSMSLVFEEFYKHLNVVGVSSYTGAGVPEFFEAVKEKTAEFERDYRPELERRQAEREKEKSQKREKELGRLMQDMNMRGPNRGAGQSARRKMNEPETISDIEDDDDDDDDDMDEQPDAEIVDPDMEDDDEDTGNEAADGGLTQRYKQALAAEQNSNATDDMSFARYIRSSNPPRP